MELEQAAELYEDFSGHQAKHVEKVRIKIPKNGLTIGTVLGIMYETKRDGKTERYKHEFKERSRPRLAASFDGKQLLLVGGNYQFTNAGIVDR